MLATFSIFCGILYMVIFDPDVYPMETSWLTGKVKADHYVHTRPEYLHELEAEQQAQNIPAEAPRRESQESKPKNPDEENTDSPGDNPPGTS